MKRRDFLKTGLTGSAVFAISGLTVFAPRTLHAATINVDLVAEGSFKTMVDGMSIFTWQFRDSNGTGPGALTSGLAVNESETVNVTVTNNLDRAINFVIPGAMTGSPSVSPGGSRTYSFTAPAPGSYFYTDSVNGEISKAMGLSGPLVVMPADGSSRLYTGGPAFDRQYTLVMNELDDRLNSAIYNDQTYDMDNYEPNYYFINGLSYPDTASDGDTLIAMNVGENIAIRFINTGCITYPQHFHGYHVKVASRNRVPETMVVDKDTIQVERDMCTDVILPVSQPGAYPLHTHYVPGVTANGVYVNPYGGALIVMRAAA
jgi:FtsP/CotA-like multicopper oxidase with cupredoxin domain